jgi:thiamine-phosphate pyrophosphorylase
VAGGVALVQLREKHLPDREMIKIGKALHAILHPLGVPLIINDKVEVALEVGAEGVHLGPSDQKAAEARAMLGKQALIGLSVENLEQAQRAFSEEVDYLAASPVFTNYTKLDCATPWGLEGLKKLCALSPYPVFGIGGIKAENVLQILECGASGVAVVSAVFNATSPEEAAREIVNRMQTYYSEHKIVLVY